MDCIQCGKKVPLHRALLKSKFCCEDHRLRQMQELNRIGVARLMDWAPAADSSAEQGKPLPVAGFLSQGSLLARIGLLESQYPQARSLAMDFQPLPLKPRLNGG